MLPYAANFPKCHSESVPKGQFVLRSASLRSELRQTASTNPWGFACFGFLVRTQIVRTQIARQSTFPDRLSTVTTPELEKRRNRKKETRGQELQDNDTIGPISAFGPCLCDSAAYDSRQISLRNKSGRLGK